jgi:lipoprotein-anchoring transpeptidase ErfK/SrfK
MRIPGRLLIAITMLGGLAALSGCSTPAAAGVWGSPGSSAAAKSAATATITGPADAATNVPTASEIAFTTTNAASTDVTLADSTGAPVEGNMRADGSAWVPAKQLGYATTYTATVTATKDGRSDTKKITFTTMNRPGNRVRVSTPLDDDQVYGVALPIVVSFDEDVPTAERANVERRLFVTSEPAQEGAWNWFNGHEIHYRSKEYWQPNTKLSVRLGVGGLPLGDNNYGEQDVTIRASIGEKIVMSTDNATHLMTVTRGDAVARSIPISLGKPSKPSSSGAMVVMGKAEHDVFVSTEPGDSYRADVNWAQRLTWGGEYIHAAPWSVGDQGKRNVSHGCTNMSDENAKWLFGITHIGDPVIVMGTEVKLDWGNGWTDWDRNWDDYLKGSALPHASAHM